MENLIGKLKLKDDLITRLSLTKVEFANTLRDQVDISDNIDGFFPGAFEAFSSSENLYKRTVDHNSFKIRKRRRFNERQFGNIRAIGRFHENSDKLIITTEINAWSNYMLFYYGAILVFYTFFMGSFSSFKFDDFFFMPIIIIHGLFMFGLPIYHTRKGVVKMKQDLEREFHFIVSKMYHSK